MSANLEDLPTELRRQILEHCILSSIKAIRLTSTVWALLGEEHLISRDFRTLPHRPDFERLLAISQHAVFSQKLECLSINLGEINEYHARHNGHFIQYMRDPEERLASQVESWGAYASFRTEKDKCMPTACSSEILVPALKDLPNLREISVSLAKCPFPDDDEETELLRQIWKIPSTRLLPRVATTERFTNLLLALVSSPSKPTALGHDRLPFEFFAQKSAIMESVSTIFDPLTQLSLVLDYSDLPNNLHSTQAFSNLSRCLRSARDTLRHLDLAFQGRTKVDIDQLLSSFHELDFSIGELHDLKLQGVACTEDALVAFLLVHKSSLKKLQLGGEGSTAPHQKANGGVHLREGTWKGVVRKVTEGLALEKFRMRGDMREVESGRQFQVSQVGDAGVVFGSADG